MITILFFPDTDEAAQAKSNTVEELKEVNLIIRHWETLVFENAKSFFTAVTLSIGAAGAVVAWATVGLNTQRMVVSLFLLAAIALSLAAIAVIFSTKAYLRKRYERRDELEGDREPEARPDQNAQPQNDGPLQMGNRADNRRRRKPVKDGLFGQSGRTLPALASCFILIIGLCVVCLFVVWLYEPERSVLAGARLHGADLSTVSNLTQRDLANACGDAKTKLPVGLVLPYCEQNPTTQNPVPQELVPVATPERTRNK